MTTFDPFLCNEIDHTTLSCGERVHEAKKTDVCAVPGILSTAPFFSGVAIVDMKMRDLSLKEYQGQYLILLFYPYDFTFNCPTEIIHFNDRLAEFHKLDCDVVAVSTDSQYAHLAWVMTPRKQGGLGEMRIVMLSDKSQKIARSYGVLQEHAGICHKGLFVIDSKQLIRHVTLTDPALSRSVDETLRVVEACKFVDQYGSTCPAGPRERLPSRDSEPNFFST